MEPATEIGRAVAILRAGGLVAFPTETVYGLGADASNPAAVGRIFAAKGRPADHPLIVHLASAADLGAWAIDVPPLARRLAEACWPGPLTIILRRAPGVPDAVTGGLDTVGLRVPAHPLALGLLRAFGGGIAAPSANRFGAVSPTTAAHVRESLGNRVDLVLDGGPCDVGVESTIVDLSSGEPALLRPGGLPRERLEAIAERPIPIRHGGPVRAPGMLESHYAPAARVLLVPPDEQPRRAAELRALGLRVGVVAFGPGGSVADAGETLHVDLGRSEEDAARGLYAALRDLDALGCDIVLAWPPDERGLGLAIADRLRRAAATSRETDEG
jgi:L-threonylcarbamoyladenylate synthase